MNPVEIEMDFVTYQDEPKYVLISRPSKPKHGCRVYQRCNPHILPNTVRWNELNMPVFVESTSFVRFSIHDIISPSTSTESTNDSAQSTGDICQSHYERGEIVRRRREYFLYSDVDEIIACKCDGVVVDRDQNGHESKQTRHFDGCNNHVDYSEDPGPPSICERRISCRLFFRLSRLHIRGLREKEQYKKKDQASIYDHDPLCAAPVPLDGYCTSNDWGE